MGKTISYTYSTVTPESAADGDHADHGFCAPGGWRFSLNDPETAADVDENPEDYWCPVAPGDVTAAISFAREHGCTEDNGDGTFYGAEYTVEDYGTGEEIQYAVHFNGDFTPATLGRISRAISR